MCVFYPPSVSSLVNLRENRFRNSGSLFLTTSVFAQPLPALPSSTSTPALRVSFLQWLQLMGIRKVRPRFSSWGKLTNCHKQPSLIYNKSCEISWFSSPRDLGGSTCYVKNSPPVINVINQNGVTFKWRIMAFLKWQGSNLIIYLAVP